MRPMDSKPALVLTGKKCSCVLTGQAVTVNGSYYRYDVHKRRKVTGQVRVDLMNVLRIGVTKTYSRFKLLIPMCFGFAALLIKAIPSAGYGVTIIPDVWEIELFSLWSMPHQDALWKICAVACVLTIPLYWLSYRNDLEINTTQGRYLLPQKGMDRSRIALLQSEFTRLRDERRREKRE